MRVDGAVLRAWRRSRGWDAPELARRFRQAADGAALPEPDSLKRQIWRWERGGLTVERYQLLYARVLGIDPDDLAAGSPGIVVAERGAEVDRAQPPANLVKTRPSGTELPDPGQFEMLRQHMNDALGHSAIGGASLDDWERSVIQYGRATRDRPANVLLADISDDVAELSRLLNQRHSASALRRLTRVAAQMSGLMCLIFCLLDDRAAFRRWARTATTAANESGDSETLAWILAQVAHGYYYCGEISEAIAIARSAYEATRTPCPGTALAFALEARGQAIQGNRTATLGALSHAESILSQLSGDAITPSAFGYNEASFRFHEGNAFTHLRDVKLALKAQDKALALCNRDDYNDWAMTRIDRAQCLIYDGDASGGLAYAVETMLDLSEDQRQGIITLRGHAILADLPVSEKALTGARDLKEILMLTSGEKED
jgi:transcriptional regulator with XRE-family HTH domain